MCSIQHDAEQLIRSEGIQVQKDNSIKDFEETGDKYLGAFEGDWIKHHEMKEKINKKYMKTIKVEFKSKLNTGNMVRTINPWRVTVVRHDVGTADWKKIIAPKDGKQ